MNVSEASTRENDCQITHKLKQDYGVGHAILLILEKKNLLKKVFFGKSLESRAVRNGETATQRSLSAVRITSGIFFCNRLRLKEKCPQKEKLKVIQRLLG
ncbi:CLUMA_CG007453, isoform A [Clunio marinus]|uniref:CLUMA_CG007453, isoform A n=1 Tax=Clunio marinus TaxID=568069 RepID=A0A1J1I4V1_9DIPT|nr:CLUMA_CG007453, isoform A [Clunio marinus]